MKQVGEQSGVEAMLDLMMPWPIQRADESFDPLAPRLRLLEMSMASKLNLFISSFIKKVLLQALLDGQAGQARAQMIFNSLVARVEAAMLDEDVLPEVVTFVADVMSAHDFFERLLDPSGLLNPDADMKGFDSAPKRDDSSIFSMVYLAVQETPYYNCKLLHTTKLIVNISEAPPKIEEHLNIFAEDDPEFVFEHLARSTNNINQIMISLPDELTESFRKDCLEVLNKYMDHLRKKRAMMTADLKVCESTSRVLSEFANIFPLHSSIPAMMSEIAETMVEAKSESSKQAFPNAVTAALGAITPDTLKSVAEVAKKCGGLHISGGNQESVSKLILELFAYLLGKLQEGDEPSEVSDFEQFCDLGNMLLSFMPARSIAKSDNIRLNIAHFKFMKNGLVLRIALRELKNDLTVAGEPFKHEAVQQVHRRMMLARSAIEKPDVDDALKNALRQNSDAANTSILAQVAAEQARLAASINSGKAFLRVASEGAADGEHWLAGAPARASTTWVGMQAHSETTICKFEDAPKLLPASMKLFEVPPPKIAEFVDTHVGHAAPPQVP